MRKLFLVLASVFLISCSNKPKENKYDSEITSKQGEYDDEISKVKFEAFIKERGLSYGDFKKVVIIPNVGCDVCISSAQQGFINHYKSLDTLYIFTAIADLKLFKNALPNGALESKNVIIDTNSILSTMGFKSIYPSTIEVSNNENYVTKSYNNN
jgi:hypothetical protein